VVQVDPALLEAPVLFRQFASKRFKGGAVDVLLAAAAAVLPIQRKLRRRPLQNLGRFLPHSPGRDYTLHVSSTVDFDVIWVRVGAGSDPAVSRVTEEIGKGPDARFEARQRCGPEVNCSWYGRR
jgi:hypothetical protein